MIVNSIEALELKSKVQSFVAGDGLLTYMHACMHVSICMYVYIHTGRWFQCCSHNIDMGQAQLKENPVLVRRLSESLKHAWDDAPAFNATKIAF